MLEEFNASPNNEFPVMAVFLEDPSMLRATLSVVFEALQDVAVRNSVFETADGIHKVTPPFLRFWSFLLEALFHVALPLPMKGHIIRFGTQAVSRGGDITEESHAHFTALLVDFFVAVLKQSDLMESLQSLTLQSLKDMAKSKQARCVLQRMVMHVSASSGFLDASFAECSFGPDEKSTNFDTVCPLLGNLIFDALSNVSTANLESTLAATSGFLLNLSPEKFQKIISSIDNTLKGSPKRRGNGADNSTTNACIASLATLLMSYIEIILQKSANEPSLLFDERLPAILNFTSEKLQSLPQEKAKGVVQNKIDISQANAGLIQSFVQILDCAAKISDDEKVKVKAHIERTVIHLIHKIVGLLYQDSTGNQTSHLQAVYSALRDTLCTLLHSPVDEIDAIPPFESLSSESQKAAVEAVCRLDIPRLFAGLEITHFFLDKLICPKGGEDHTCDEVDKRLIQVANRRIAELGCFQQFLSESPQNVSTSQSKDIQAQQSSIQRMLKHITDLYMLQPSETEVLPQKSAPVKPQVVSTSAKTPEAPKIPPKQLPEKPKREEKVFRYEREKPRSDAHHRDTDKKRHRDEYDERGSDRHRRHRSPSPAHRSHRSSDREREKERDRRTHREDSRDRHYHKSSRDKDRRRDRH